MERIAESEARIAALHFRLSQVENALMQQARSVAILLQIVETMMDALPGETRRPEQSQATGKH